MEGASSDGGTAPTGKATHQHRNGNSEDGDDDAQSRVVLNGSQPRRFVAHPTFAGRTSTRWCCVCEPRAVARRLSLLIPPHSHCNVAALLAAVRAQNYACVRTPFEVLSRLFRQSQKLLEKTLSAVVDELEALTASVGSGVTADAATARIDSLLAQLEDLKREVGYMTVTERMRPLLRSFGCALAVFRTTPMCFTLYCVPRWRVVSTLPHPRPCVRRV